MGHYTQFEIKLMLKKKTPQKVIDALEYAFNPPSGNEDGDDVAKYLSLFGNYRKIPEVFLASRADVMFAGSFNDLLCEDGQYTLHIDIEFQNRDREIDKFLDFIIKYVEPKSVKDLEVVGSIKPEDDEKADIVVIKAKGENIAKLICSRYNIKGIL